MKEVKVLCEIQMFGKEGSDSLGKITKIRFFAVEAGRGRLAFRGVMQKIKEFCEFHSSRGRGLIFSENFQN